MYWLEGALVSLVPRLNRPGVLEKAVGDVVRYGRDECGRSALHAVLLSIEHVVLLKSYPNNILDRTELLPLITIKYHRSMNAVQRYGTKGVDEIYQATLQEAEEEAEEEAEQEDEDEDEDTMDKREAAASETSQTWTPAETFTSLIALFEASTRQGLKPTNVEGHNIPNEVYEEILSYVSDMQTYNACLKASRRIRSLCHRRPLVMDNLKLFQVQSQKKSKLSTFHAVASKLGSTYFSFQNFQMS